MTETDISELEWLLWKICPKASRERYLALLSKKKSWKKLCDILNHSFNYSSEYVVKSLNVPEITPCVLLADKNPHILRMPFSMAIEEMDSFFFGSLFACKHLKIGGFKSETPSSIVWFKI